MKNLFIGIDFSKEKVDVAVIFLIFFVFMRLRRNHPQS